MHVKKKGVRGRCYETEKMTTKKNKKKEKDENGKSGGRGCGLSKGNRGPVCVKKNKQVRESIHLSVDR